jgi:hypothetical protein
VYQDRWDEERPVKTPRSYAKKTVVKRKVVNNNGMNGNGNGY